MPPSLPLSNPQPDTLRAIDFLMGCGTPQQVCARTRQVIDTYFPRGRCAVGSGNSIPSCVPVENYLAMVAEALA